MKTILYDTKRWSSATKALLFMLLTLLSFFKAQAQVSFRNPTYASGIGVASEFMVYNSSVDDNNNAVQVPAPGDGELTVSYFATLFRPVGTTTQGYVAIRLGTAPTSLVTPDLNAAEHPIVDNSLWKPALDINGGVSTAYEQLVVTGTFTISGDIVGGNTGIYAAYYDGGGLVPPISHPVLLKILPPDPDKNPYLIYMPCAGTEICGDQCVPYGTMPKLIKGRVLATYNSQAFAKYLSLCAQKGIPAWAESSEYEKAEWQCSYDNVNWKPVADGFDGSSASYRPPACTRTTYYRRHSTHLVRSWWEGNIDEDWYISNVVKITPTAPIPTTAQPNVKSCGSGVAVSANTSPAIVSYNWWVPYAGWTVSDGSQAPFSTFNNSSSFVTSKNTNIIISPPSNVVPGDYVISFSANGVCGDKSTDAHLTVTIDFTGTSAPVSGYFNLTSSSTYCYPQYELRAAPVAGATSYAATLSTGDWAPGYFDPNMGNVVFQFYLPGPQVGISAQIVALGPCGASNPYYVSAQDLSGPPPNCGLYQTELQAYPNPANTSLTLQAESTASVGYLYNNLGKVIRTIPLNKNNVSKSVDVSTLPNGLYNLIIESPTHKRHLEHIVIQH